MHFDHALATCSAVPGSFWACSPAKDGCIIEEAEFTSPRVVTRDCPGHSERREIRRRKEDIMKYGDFSRLRRDAGWDLHEAAVTLGIDSESVSGWEDEDLREQEFSEEEAKAIRTAFLGERIARFCDRAFDAIPSEAVAIWIVIGQRDCVLLPYASRLHDLDHDTKIAQPNIRFETRLVDLSLTTYPFRSGRALNLAGDAITEHESKKFKKNRSAVMFGGGVCESLLHVPAFVESEKERYPLLLLTFENKLDSQRRVIVPSRGDRTSVYSEADEAEATRLANEFKVGLLPLMIDLGMSKTTG
jgi:hypothetical protein